MTLSVPAGYQCSPRPATLDLQLRVHVGDFIYQEGDPRDRVFRIEKGAVAVYRRRLGRPNSTMEIATCGDYIGLGCLEQHSENARAIAYTTLTCFFMADFATLAESDEHLRRMQADAIDREFEARKAMLVRSARATPAECLAAFLICVSRLNAHEGRDPLIIADSLSCGTVTGLIDVDIDTLEYALLELKRLGLIEQTGTGAILIKALEGLEQLAESSEPYAEPEPRELALADPAQSAACHSAV